MEKYKKYSRSPVVHFRTVAPAISVSGVPNLVSRKILRTPSSITFSHHIGLTVTRKKNLSTPRHFVAATTAHPSRGPHVGPRYFPRTSPVITLTHHTVLGHVHKNYKCKQLTQHQSQIVWNTVQLRGPPRTQIVAQIEAVFRAN